MSGGADDSLGRFEAAVRFLGTGAKEDGRTGARTEKVPEKFSVEV